MDVLGGIFNGDLAETLRGVERVCCRGILVAPTVCVISWLELEGERKGMRIRHTLKSLHMKGKETGTQIAVG